MLRGLVVAAFAVLVALTAHVVGGGAVPGPLGLAFPLLLTWVLTSALIGTRPRLLPTILAALAAQGVFHLTFSLGSLGSTSSGAAGAGSASPTGHAGHAGHAGHSVEGMRATLESAGAEVLHAGHADSGWPMLVAHLAAAALTAAALYRSEVLLRTASRLGRPFADVLHLQAWQPIRPRLRQPRPLPFPALRRRIRPAETQAIRGPPGPALPP